MTYHGKLSRDQSEVVPNAPPMDSLGGKLSANRPITFLLSSLATGGSEKKVVNIANELARRGWAVTVAYLGPPQDLEPAVAEDVKVVNLQRIGKFDIRVPYRLVQLLRQNGSQVLMCINLYPLLYGFLARYLFRMPLMLIAVTNETEFVRRSDKWKMKIYAPMLRLADRIIFGSRYQKDLWIKRYRLEIERTDYIYNGVDTHHFSGKHTKRSCIDIRDEYGISTDAFVFGSIGRFRIEKRYSLAIEACASLRDNWQIDAHCILVGGGIEEDALVSLANRLGCGANVHIVSDVRDVRPYIQGMDVFVLTSVSETFSNAALEAMSMSRPVILPRVGGCPEMVVPGKNGYLFRSGDVGDLVSHLLRFARNEIDADKMGGAAREFVRDGFTFTRMVDSYEGLIDR